MFEKMQISFFPVCAPKGKSWSQALLEETVETVILADYMIFHVICHFLYLGVLLGYNTFFSILLLRSVPL